jgi:hypothetical protein
MKKPQLIQGVISWMALGRMCQITVLGDWSLRVQQVGPFVWPPGKYVQSIKKYPS